MRNTLLYPSFATALVFFFQLRAAVGFLTKRIHHPSHINFNYQQQVSRTTTATFKIFSTGSIIQDTFNMNSSPSLVRQLLQQQQYNKQLRTLQASSLFLPQAEHLKHIRVIQNMGETFFLAMVVVACLQAVVALFQYRTNPAGELMVPPGPTFGVCYPPPPSTSEESSPLSSTPNDPNKNKTNGKNAASNLRENRPFWTRFNKSKQKHDDIASQDTTSVATSTSSPSSSSTKAASQKNGHTEFWNRINQWMFVLIPWTSRRLAFWVQSNTHIFHLGFIVTLAGFFDIPNHFLFLPREERHQARIDRHNIQKDKPTAITGVLNNDNPKHVIVIGDSLAVGLGSVNHFDSLKNATLPYCKIENLNITTDDNPGDESQGPIFPRVLAETLAESTRSIVSWRSAGVDGGTTQHIHDLLLDVVQDEVEHDRIPDIVVILCGINDMKDSFVKPRLFRGRLKRLMKDIHGLAPQTAIVLPSMPTQMFHRNSPLNIFPLNIFLDTIVGFWDSQKKYVAERYNKRYDIDDRVIYIRLGPHEVMDWYHHDSKSLLDAFHDAEGRDTNEQQSTTDQYHHGETDSETSLIAADGVHPNARCYARWASSLVKSLMSLASPVT